uniref:Transmembrane protein n=1 Tax=Papilio xuthus TaxID=66420 RepID=I4DQI7_PAPXU|nr:unknown unsecreted protein [Papilio xuthus]
MNLFLRLKIIKMHESHNKNKLINIKLVTSIINIIISLVGSFIVKITGSHPSRLGLICFSFVQKLLFYQNEIVQKIITIAISFSHCKRHLFKQLPISNQNHCSHFNKFY